MLEISCSFENSICTFFWFFQNQIKIKSIWQFFSFLFWLFCFESTERPPAICSGHECVNVLPRINLRTKNLSKRSVWYGICFSVYKRDKQFQFSGSQSKPVSWLKGSVSIWKTLITQEKQRTILLRTPALLAREPLNVLRPKLSCGFIIQNRLKFRKFKVLEKICDCHRKFTDFVFVSSWKFSKKLRN